jgi:putative NADPH-quinone reductase
LDVVFSKEGQETLDAIMAKRPYIVRARWREKIIRYLSLLILERNVREADKALVIEAVKFITSGTFGAHLRRVDDLEAFRNYRAWKFDRDIYYQISRKVKRWEPSPSKPQKPPNDMKIVAFCASPRKNGNTAVLIKEAMRGAFEAGAIGEYILLQDLNIKCCIGCRKCKEPGFKDLCVIKDDMTEIYRKIIASDAVIIGFPIYTGREAAQLGVFWDRLDCFRRYDYNGDRITSTRILEPGRRGMIIGTWGAKDENMYDDIIQRVCILMNGHRIEPVEAISASGFAGLLKGFDEDKKAMILRYPEELRKVYEAGRTLITGII